MLNLEMLKRFAGVNAEDTVLEGCLDAAIAWYTNAGVERAGNNRLYEFWVCNLAAWMYDNRGGNAEIPQAIIASVHQLREAD